MEPYPKQLSWGVEGYRLDVMRSRFHSFRSAVATGLSLWMAVLACLMGCTLPNFASSGPIQASSVQKTSSDQTPSGLMGNMENCPHHSNGNSPAKPQDGKPVHSGAMSCCPIEVTVAPKPATVTLQIVRTHGFVLASGLNLVTSRFYRPVEFVASVSQSGRDTLLETHLLRI
jgi:hypothetical protein